MRRVWTVVAVAGAALALAAPASAAAAPLSSGSPANPRSAELAAGAVTALSVVPGDGRAAVVITLDSAVTVNDFVLKTPDRIVLDLVGAKLGMAPRYYDRVARGGITNVRYAQYKADVVRVVIELSAAHRYEVSREGRELRISVEGGSASFAAWHSGRAQPAVERDLARTLPDAVSAQGEPERYPAIARPSAQRAVGTAARAVMTAAAPSSPQQQSQLPRITVTYQDADIRDVLAAFAAFSGRTIVVGREVEGTITAEIRDQPWDVALQAILTANGLAASEDASGIITVDSYRNIAAKQASEPLTTQLISVNYANAATLAPTIRALLSRDCAAAAPGAQAQPGGQCVVRGAVAVDSATNTLIVNEVASRMGDIVNYVSDLDVRTPQVALKMKLISIDRSATEQLGLSYDIGDRNSAFNSLLPRVDADGSPIPGEAVVLTGDAFLGVANAQRSFQGNSALNLIFSTMVGRFTLTAFLDAATRATLSDVQAEPTIVTLDNRRAEILVGQETPIRVLDISGAGGTGGARANVTFKETGIILSVLPHITNNRMIMMQIHAEQSAIQVVGLADLPYFFDKRRADNQLLVADGETAVIGGLTQTTITKNRSGIPFLVDLPLIGKLFGQTSSIERKQDLLILITPHIVDEGEVVRTTPPGPVPPR